MSPVVTIPNRGRAETNALTRALINLAAAGLRTHCSDPTLSELWVSDHPGERREAAKLCRHCPSSLNAELQQTPETNAGTSGEDATTHAADNKRKYDNDKAERIS